MSFLPVKMDLVARVGAGDQLSPPGNGTCGALCPFARAASVAASHCAHSCVRYGGLPFHLTMSVTCSREGPVMHQRGGSTARKNCLRSWVSGNDWRFPWQNRQWLECGGICA